MKPNKKPQGEPCGFCFDLLWGLVTFALQFVNFAEYDLFADFY